MSFLTSRGDYTRSGANSQETLLTPANVNSNSFGHLFSTPIDYQALAQPLYVPDVNIPGLGMHNVVYVVTQNNSAYAIDADNGTQLWQVNLGNGGVPASVAAGNLPCGLGQGFDEEGAVGTPVIDPTTDTMYVVAKTVINGKVMHFLHALNIATGAEQTSMNSPVQITASSVSMKGHVTNFNSLHQKNRPGALLLNGVNGANSVLYLGFGSNGCNDDSTGWILAYNASNLQQVGVFNDAPDSGLASIWQTGNGLAADEQGNIYASTAEDTNYDVTGIVQDYPNSILQLSPLPWAKQNEPNEPAGSFTPFNVSTLNENDRDVSSVGPVVLPDQQGFYPYELIASGKNATVYVLNRDQMGQFVPGGPDNVIQEFQLIAGGDYMCSPAYWNGLLYFMPDAAPLQVYQVSNGELSPFAQTAQNLVGSHSPSISANGNSNGIVWLVNGNLLQAYNAVSLQLLYSSKLPVQLAHFATQTVVNGKVYVATQGSLEAYGLLTALTVSGGNNQTAPVTSTLPAPVQFVAANPYSGQLQAGITVTFSDGGKGGVFTPPSMVTNGSGVVSTMYTFPKKSGVYTLTASATGLASAFATATATPLAATYLGVNSGENQTGAPGSTLPNPIVARAHDNYENPIAGVTVTFSATLGATVNPITAVTNSAGLASTTVQLPTTTGTVKVTASSPGLYKAVFTEYSATPAAATVKP